MSMYLEQNIQCPRTILYQMAILRKKNYTERKKKRIFWLLKRRIYYKNKFWLDTSNLYPLIPTIKFHNKFL